jgi:hypothetical protein
MKDDARIASKVSRLEKEIDARVERENLRGEREIDTGAGRRDMASVD